MLILITYKEQCVNKVDININLFIFLRISMHTNYLQKLTSFCPYYRVVEHNCLQTLNRIK